MQTAIFILVVLTLVRGAFVLRKVLSIGSIEKQIKVAEDNLEVIKKTKDGVFALSWLLSLGWGLFLVSISTYILSKMI